MRRAVCSDQADLFPASEIFTVCPRREPPAEIPPLPFARNQEIDAQRAARILDTDLSTIHRLLQRQLISGYQVFPGRTSSWRISHASVVEYCDRLRVQYQIEARKPAAGARPRDIDILPFLASETISLAVVLDSLDIGSKRTAIKLIETGDLVGYRLMRSSRSPWRIHRPSLVSYIERLRRAAGVT